MGFQLTKPIKKITDCMHYLRGEPKTGKALVHGTKVFTPSGTKNIEDFVAGDLILNTYGGRSPVLNVFPQGLRDVAKVVFSNGEKTICDLDHLWAVGSFKDDVAEEEQSYLVSNVMTTKDIMENMVDCGKVYFLPKFAPLDFDARELPIPAMHLGAALFDPEKSDKEKLTIKAIMTKEHRLPKEYLFNTLANRLDFIFGALSHANKELPADFSLKLKPNMTGVADDLIWLARSVGWEACRQENVILISPSANMFPLFSGELFYDNLTAELYEHFAENSWINDPTIYIKEIELLEKKMPCTCIEVGSINSLYMIDNFIPTHNTTLFRDLVLHENDGDPTKGLLISFGAEEGYKSIENLQFERIEYWDKEPDEEDESRGFIQLVDDLVENNKEYGITMYAIDTVDQMIPIIERYICELSERETMKACKSINDAFGGYGRGKKRALEEIALQLARLAKIGLHPCAISHTKMKEKTDEFTGDEYTRYTTNITSDYDALFSTTAQIIMTVVNERQFENGRLIGTRPTMYFRDNGLVDAGSRFSGMPESLPMSLENYIKAFNIGVEATYQNKNGEVQPAPIVRKQEFDADKARAELLGKIANWNKDKKLLKKDLLATLKAHSIKDINDIDDADTFAAITKDLETIVDAS